MIRAIFSQRVDIALFLINIGLLAWYIIGYPETKFDPDLEFHGMLLLNAGYIVFNVINKAKCNMTVSTKKNSEN
jgi:hypothetical protein